MSGPSLFETLLIFAAGAGLMYLVAKSNEKNEKEVDDADELRMNPALPAPVAAPTPITVVLANPAALAPSPVAIQTVAPIVEAPKRRRSKKKNPAPVTITVEPAPPSV
jgi:hypothetical protein